MIPFDTVRHLRLLFAESTMKYELGLRAVLFISIAELFRTIFRITLKLTITTNFGNDQRILINSNNY